MANGGNHGIKENIIDSQILEIDRELNRIEINGSQKREIRTILKRLSQTFLIRIRRKKIKQTALKVYSSQVIVMWPT